MPIALNRHYNNPYFDLCLCLKPSIINSYNRAYIIMTVSLELKENIKENKGSLIMSVYKRWIVQEPFLDIIVVFGYLP